MESQPDQTKKHYQPLHYTGYVEFLSDGKTPIPSWRLLVKTESDEYIDSNLPREYNPSFAAQVEGIVAQSKMASIELKELAYILALEQVNDAVLPKLWDLCGFNSHNELIKIMVGEKSENGEDVIWKVSNEITADDVHSRVQCWYWLLCRWAFSEKSEYFSSWRHIEKKLPGELRPDQNCFYIDWSDLQEFFMHISRASESTITLPFINHGEAEDNKDKKPNVRKAAIVEAARSVKKNHPRYTVKQAAQELIAWQKEREETPYSEKHLMKLIKVLGFVPGKSGRPPKK